MSRLLKNPSFQGTVQSTVDFGGNDIEGGGAAAFTSVACTGLIGADGDVQAASGAWSLVDVGVLATNIGGDVDTLKGDRDYTLGVLNSINSLALDANFSSDGSGNMYTSGAGYFQNVYLGWGEGNHTELLADGSASFALGALLIDNAGILTATGISTGGLSSTGTVSAATLQSTGEVQDGFGNYLSSTSNLAATNSSFISDLQNGFAAISCTAITVTDITSQGINLANAILDLQGPFASNDLLTQPLGDPQTAPSLSDFGARGQVVVTPGKIYFYVVGTGWQYATLTNAP